MYNNTATIQFPLAQEAKKSVGTTKGNWIKAFHYYREELMKTFNLSLRCLNVKIYALSKKL